MNQTIEEKNKKLVLKAFATLFNKRDYAAAGRYWSPNSVLGGIWVSQHLGIWYQLTLGRDILPVAFVFGNRMASSPQQSLDAQRKARLTQPIL